MSELVRFKSAEEKRQVVTEVMDRMLGGEGLKDLQDHLISTYGFNRITANTFLLEVKDEAGRIVSQQAEHIIPTHLDIYEEVFRYFDGVDFIPGKLKAMRFKEKLMGLHKEDRTVEINNKQTTIIEKQVSYDTNKLNQKEQSRLNELLKKAK